MSEGRTYLCSWKLDSHVYTIWVRSRPGVRVSGLTFSQAYDKLIYKWLESGSDDCEPIFTFDRSPPPEPLDAKYSNIDLMWFEGTGYTSDSSERRESLFDGPRCAWCGEPTGPRNDSKRQLTSTVEGHVSACVRDNFVGESPILVSREFLNLLSNEEQQCLDWIPCVGVPRSRKQFFEARPRSFVPYAAAIELELSGWRCDSCGAKVFSIRDPRTSFLHAVSQLSLPQPLPALFAIGSRGHFQIGASSSRIRELLSSKYSRGMNAGRLGVVPPSLAIAPTLRLRENEADQIRLRQERAAEDKAELDKYVANLIASSRPKK